MDYRQITWPNEKTVGRNLRIPPVAPPIFPYSAKPALTQANFDKFGFVARRCVLTPALRLMGLKILLQIALSRREFICLSPGTIVRLMPSQF